MGLFGGAFKIWKKGSPIGKILDPLGLFGSGGLLGKKLPKEEEPEPPVVTPPPVMPLPDDDAIAKSKKRSLAAQLARRGRQSTILTDPVTGGGDTLG